MGEGEKELVCTKWEEPRGKRLEQSVGGGGGADSGELQAGPLAVAETVS